MSQETVEYIISITSKDRIGIVHEISSALAGLAGNIEDSHQTILCGYYTMIMRTAFPASVSLQAIKDGLAAVDAQSPTPMNILVHLAEEALPQAGSENRYVLTASGADQIGFVAKVSGFCVEHQINILDLSTTLSDGEFVMMLEVDLSRCVSIDEIRQALAVFGQMQDLKVALQHHDIFKAINEISLPIRPNGEG